MKLLYFTAISSLSNLAHSKGNVPFPGSVISSASERVDVFYAYGGQILHKYHANPAAGWNQGVEDMGLAVPSKIYPSATALGNQLHIFVNVKGSLQHKFWDGSQWLPSKGWETLGSGLAEDSNLAVTARGNNGLHIVGKAVNGSYAHKYYDGSSWKPDGDKDLEFLGDDGFDDVEFESVPAINSWGPDRLDIVGTLENGTLLHKYWDGSQWNPSASSWEQWGDDFQSDPVLTSWGESRLDVWSAREEKDETTIAHRWWDGHSLSNWEDHACAAFSGLSVTHWSPNRIDIVTHLTESNSFAHKYWDGYQWNPSADSAKWSDHGPSSFSASSGVSSIAWGANNLNVFAVDDKDQLRWQLWEGSQWLPSVNDFYNLGSAKGSSSSSSSEKQDVKSKMDATVKDQANTILRIQDSDSMDL